MECEEAIVTFYQSWEWQCVIDIEWTLNRVPSNSPSPPLRIFAFRSILEWPSGEFSLREKAC